tara:strand:+ start:154 stop:606 length:453 start_codon:yes stop_codon:yes gene_type:complete
MSDCLRAYILDEDKNPMSGTTEEGYDWEIIRNSMGLLCGYIILKKGHKYYDEPDFTESKCPFKQPHGGVTFDQIEKNQRRLGFDTGHYGDLMNIGFVTLSEIIEDPCYNDKYSVDKALNGGYCDIVPCTYKNYDFVLNEIVKWSESIGKN